VSVLGRIEVRVDGRLADLGTPRQRSIMAALALSEGRPVSFDVLVDRVWGTVAPATAVGTLQRYVATLRQALEPDRGADETPSVLVTSGAAYALHASPGHRDVDRFQEGVARARRLLACVPDPLRPVAPHDRVAEVSEALELVDGVLRLWRGEPYAELGDHDGQVVAERARLHDLHSGAVELRLVALLALGRHVETLGDLETMTSLHPLHERWWALRAVALLRSGRQADALEVLGTVRAMLADELGVDPSPPLQELYGDLLRQAPSLAWTSGPAAAAAPAATRVRQAAPPSPRWPLVARDHEAAVLRDLVADTAEGRFRPALVTGEAGVGKTRLVQETVLAAYAAGATVAVGRCSEQAPPLWPIRSALEALGGADDLDRLHTRPADFSTWQLVVDLLRRATVGGPVVVVVEDLHRADTETLLLLEHLVADRELADLALVLTRRTKDGDDPRQSRLAAAVARSAGARLDLAPLTPAEARRLALVVDPDLPDPDAVGRRSGGNPFFVAELALSGGRVGGGLADVVRTRLTALEPTAQAALELASAVDDCFDLELVAAVLDATPDDAESALEPALRAGLVRRATGSSSYAFEHDVVREVLREGLPVSSVARCRQVAERLRDDAPRQRPARDERVHRPVDPWPAVVDLVGDALPAAARAS
jgi:DNA-binding SARP family transcriptional activator